MESEVEIDASMNPRLYRSLGIFLLILGLISLIFPYFITTLVLYVIGMIILVAGALMAASGLGADKTGWKNIGIGALTMILAILMLIYADYSLWVLTGAVTVFMLLNAVLMILIGFETKPLPGWSAAVASGVVVVLISTLMFGWMWEMSDWLIGFLLGLDLSIVGATILFIGHRNIENMEKEVI